ncbi:CLCN3 [Cordylochernes scorpioides]|uniref:CLCN3 n=1 Tax=Cordylochernes scorpioides TaxID=51811 RepID=A0ABY6K2M8_9ARAC|nr:CLCN3 [Cordylochernes scorpioides]
MVYLYLLEIPSRPASVPCCPRAGIPSRTHDHDCPVHSTSAYSGVFVTDIAFDMCRSACVGETGRTTHIRLTEHKRNIRNIWKLPHEPRPKKARQVRSNVKVLLTVFFDCRGVVHHEFLPQGRTVNKEYYLQAMRNLREAIRQKRPDLWKNKNWLLHHDNAPAHTSCLCATFWPKTTH